MPVASIRGDIPVVVSAGMSVTGIPLRRPTRAMERVAEFATGDRRPRSAIVRSSSAGCVSRWSSAPLPCGMNALEAGQNLSESDTGASQAGQRIRSGLPLSECIYHVPSSSDAGAQDVQDLRLCVPVESVRVAGGVAIARAVAWNLTHEKIHPKAITSAIAKAAAPYSQELTALLEKLPAWLQQDDTQAVAEIASSGYSKEWKYNPAYGITGFVVPTVLISLYYFLRFPSDFCQALSGVLKAGGDIDTTAAITGNLCGAFIGKKGLPAKLLQRLKNCTKIEDLAKNLRKRRK